MNARLGTSLVVAACAVFCASPLAAHAADVLLGYGVAYPSGTHRGVDIACAEGGPVAALAGGTVVFAGAVPADGGGTCNAVSILTDDGLRVSVLPLAEVRVVEGDVVTVDDSLGTLAATGDDSSLVSHLHVSLRRGDAYLDPSGLLPMIEEQREVATPVGTPLVTSPDGPSSSSGGVTAVHVPSASAPSVQPAVATATTPVAAAAGGLVSHATPVHTQIPVGAGVPEASSLRSHVELTRRMPTMAMTASAPPPLSIAAMVAAIGACAALGVRRVAAARAC